MVLVTVYMEDPLHRAFLLFALALSQLVVHVSHWPYSTKFDNLLDLQLTVLLTAIAGLLMTNAIVSAIPTSEMLQDRESQVYLLLQILLVLPAVLMGAYAITVQLPMLLGRPPLQAGRYFLSHHDQERLGMVANLEDEGDSSEMEDLISGHTGTSGAIASEAPARTSARMLLADRRQASSPMQRAHVVEFDGSTVRSASSGMQASSELPAELAETQFASSPLGGQLDSSQLQPAVVLSSDSCGSREDTVGRDNGPVAEPSLAFIAQLHVEEDLDEQPAVSSVREQSAGEV